MTNREKAALETRAKLLKTGQKLIIKHGLSNICVEDITNTAGVAKGTFYTYFKRKEDIVFEICRDSFAQIAERFLADKEKDIIKKLENYCTDFINEIQRYDVNICREWLRDVITPAIVTDNKDTQKWQYDIQTMHNVLKAAVENGELKPDAPIETLTYIAISQMYGMMLGWCMSDEEFNPRDWVKRFCDVEIRSILQPYINLK